MISTLNSLFICVVWICVCAAAPAMAQVRVTKSAGEKISFDMSAYNASADEAAQIFRRTLEADLARSGWLVKAPPGQAELAITGTCEARNSVRAQCFVFGRTTQRNYLSKSYSAELNAPRRLAHQVADEIVEAVTGRKGMASGRIALVGTRTGRKEIYLCDADGQGMIQLTRDNSVSLAPMWGPDGRQLVYTSYLKGFPDVYLIDIVTGNRRRVASYSGLNTGAAISPDGRDMALILSKDGNPELYIKNMASGALTRLTQTQRAAEASPAWSPDGRNLVYVSDVSGTPQLYVVARSGGAPRRLTSRGSQNVAPDWGPNGLIVYSSLIGGRYQVCVIDPNTLENKQISADGADYEDPCWAPNGRHIACGRSVQYQSRLYLLDTMGDPPIVLTDYPGDWYSPSWTSKY